MLRVITGMFAVFSLASLAADVSIAQAGDLAGLEPDDSRSVTSVPADPDREFACMGRAEDLARFLAEYGPERDDIEGLIAERTPPGTGGKPGTPAYMVHRSPGIQRRVPCAGDAEARTFCWQVAAKMVDLFGISPEEAVARVNRHWSQVRAETLTADLMSIYARVIR